MSEITADMEIGYSIRVKVLEHSDDFLTAKSWTFWYNNHGLVVDCYISLERKTKRHNYKPVARWTRLDRRSNDIDIYPLIPLEVKRAALDKFTKTLEIKE